MLIVLHASVRIAIENLIQEIQFLNHMHVYHSIKLVVIWKLAHSIQAIKLSITAQPAISQFAMNAN